MASVVPFVVRCAVVKAQVDGAVITCYLQACPGVNSAQPKVLATALAPLATG